MEFFGAGTAAIVAPVKKIGWNGQDLRFVQGSDDGLGPVGRGIFKMMTGIQTGEIHFEDWGISCE